MNAGRFAADLFHVVEELQGLGVAFGEELFEIPAEAEWRP